jgi:hypothetical protein
VVLFDSYWQKKIQFHAMSDNFVSVWKIENDEKRKSMFSTKQNRRKFPQKTMKDKTGIFLNQFSGVRWVYMLASPALILVEENFQFHKEINYNYVECIETSKIRMSTGKS